MCIRVKKNYLTFKGDRFQCSIGRSGFSKNKREGDGFTPVGTFYIENIYYRADKIKNFDTKINTIKIHDKNTKTLVWSNSFWYSGLELQRTIDICLKNGVLQIQKLFS